MNPTGILFELRNREWFYAVNNAKDLDVFGPFCNSLVANTHMSTVHCTRSCHLVYKEDVKIFFADDWNEIQQKITQSRANPKRSNNRGQRHGF